MKMIFLKHWLPFLFAFSLVGCATNPPADWDSRVGHYTYADAVHELGQPDREIQLGNGSTEFKWFARTAPSTAASNPSLAVGGLNNPNAANKAGWGGANSAVGSGAFAGTGFNSRYLELTFDSHGVLSSWSKNY